MSRKNPSRFLVILSFCATLIASQAFAQESAAYPAISGTYRSSTQHPRVFMTQVDLDDLSKRAHVPGSFSAQNFARLSNQIRVDVAANVDWDAAYSGCDLDVYLHVLNWKQRQKQQQAETFLTRSVSGAGGSDRALSQNP